MWEGSEISHEFAPECLARAGFIWRSRGATLQLWTMQHFANLLRVGYEPTDNSSSAVRG